MWFFLFSVFLRERGGRRSFISRCAGAGRGVGSPAPSAAGGPSRRLAPWLMCAGCRLLCLMFVSVSDAPPAARDSL
jgi:hypothetical protein